MTIFHRSKNRVFSNTQSCSFRKDIFHKKNINLNKEIAFTMIGLVVTFLSTVFALTGIIRITQNASFGKLVEQAIFAVILLLLVYGNVLYQITRIGYFRRLLKHKPASWKSLNRFFAGQAPRLTILIPSYKEELRVIRQSILSSALQHYPNKRVVLLIDDPTYPKDPRGRDMESLNAARKIPTEIEEIISLQRERISQHRNEYLVRKNLGKFNTFVETMYLCGIYRDIAAWYLKNACLYMITDHTDELFVEKTFYEPARHYNFLSEELAEVATEGSGYPDENNFDIAYQKLVSIFNVEITFFERKQFENLSHEPNKAMNLNSYIGLIGKSFAEVRRNGKIYLEEVPPGTATLTVPNSDFLITLDADSILSFDYAIRLIDVMQKPGHERLAVAQTPYSAVPNPASVLERVAGATTDMQYLIHQGFTFHNATYWVGANALLRLEALQDIKESVTERGHTVDIFVQDRTVIEDTESTLDLVAKNWSLYNYPERLSYSATPPDFGSLLIQRRRWANGGLILFPKLCRYLSRDFNFIKKFRECFMRAHYLISIAAVNFGLLILLLYPFNDNLNNPWLPLTVLPYYFFYGRDLIQAGYHVKDIFRVYALNLLLVPVNLAGLLKSIEQGITKKKIPFKRTPKVMGRTTSPVLYLVIEFVVLAYFFLGSLYDIYNYRFNYALFGFFNGMFFLYAFKRFIGFKEAIEDIQAAFQKPTTATSSSRQFLCPECTTSIVPPANLT